MKRREMQRHIRAEMRQNPFRQLSRFRRIVVQRRNHQVRNLEPNFRFFLQPLERLEYGLKMRQRNFPVEIFRKRFQVDVRRVDMVIHLMKSFIRDVATGHHYGLQAVPLRFFGYIDQVFGPNRSFVVGERERFTAVFQREQRYVFRRNRLRTDLIRVRFGNVPVLAEEAAHVAPRRSHTENSSARKKMIQGLFLDGINLQRGWRAVAQAVELAALIDSNEAESGLAGTDVAVARAEIAVNFPVRLRLPPASLVKFPRFLEDLQLLHRPSSQTTLYP